MNILLVINGDAIRNKRILLKLTQEELAIKSDVRIPDLCRIETGKKQNVTLKTLGKLSRALNLKLNEITKEIAD